MKRLWRHRFRRTTLVCALCVAFLIGIGLARLGINVAASIVVAVLPFAVLIIRRKNIATLVLLALLGMTTGCWRGGIYTHWLSGYTPLVGQKVALTGWATGDAVYNDKSQLVFTLTNIQIDGRRMPGEAYITGFGLPAVYRGDELTVHGKLRSGFGPYQASMSYAALDLEGHHQTLVETIRQKFAAGMQSALPEPLASFGLGLLIGQRNTLPKSISQQLLMVGLIHIIAVSGYNLTILVRAARRLFSRASKFQTMLASVSFVGVFLLFTGSSPLIVRASIVSMLSIAAWYYGRDIKPSVLILVAAIITAYVNPLYVWGNASWYLSFLAFYGVLVLAPLLRARLPARLQDKALVQVGLESLCAEVMTLPYVLFTFGQISFIGLIANVLVVTLTPLAMLLSFVAGLAGMLIAPIAGWFAWPARLILTYMLDVATILSRIPHIFAQHIGLSVQAMVLLYGVALSVSIAIWYKNKSKYAIITDNNELETEGV